MIIRMLLLFATASAATPAPVPQPSYVPPELTCVAANTPQGKNRRCHVTIPPNKAIKHCVAAEKAARRCALDRKARYVAWVVSTQGADCRLLKKRTDWSKRVAIKVGKHTKPGAGTCELRVVLQ